MRKKERGERNAMLFAVLHLMEDMIIPFILALGDDSTLGNGNDGAERRGNELVKKRLNAT
jgi:hypothetical protein